VFDHVTLRVSDLPATELRFQALLDPLGMDETFSNRNFALWDDFALTDVDAEHPVTTRAHVAFVAPTRDAVDAFWQAGIDAGFADNGGPGPRSNYTPDYYGAFLLDAEGNNLEAVHRDDHRRGGNVDHVALRVADVAAAADFYALAGAAAGFDAGPRGPERARFSGRGSGGLLALVAGPPTEHLHLAFPGDDAAVRRFYAEAVAAGHPGNGEPGERPRYHAGYYAAYVFDPDGNNVEVVNHHR
jgi:catechol 2,3-dioxygenase-like lactoylglutathione lyase family enzyme